MQPASTGASRSIEPVYLSGWHDVMLRLSTFYLCSKTTPLLDIVIVDTPFLLWKSNSSTPFALVDLFSANMPIYSSSYLVDLHCPVSTYRIV